MATTSVQTLNRARYSGLDFDTHFDDLRARAQVEFAEDFNDFVLSSLGIMLMDLVAYGLDSLSFYLDRRASDAYLATARTRKGVTRLADQLGYKVGASVASSVDLDVALQTAVAFNVTVPKGFQFKGPNNLLFESAEAVVFPAGSGPTDIKTIPCYQGVTVTENFVSDGTANQLFTLKRVPDQSFIVQGTVGVLVNAAVWTESDFITFDKTDQFSVSYGDDPPTLSFGDGVAGNIPGAGASITVTYIASRGKAGQIAEGTITAAKNQLVANFTNIPLTVNNPSPSIGGDDPEALAKVKKLAGKVFKSRRVAVTAEDYKSLSTAFADPLYGRVASAQAISSRSAEDDLFLQNTIAAISGYLDPIKGNTNAQTTIQLAQSALAATALSTLLTALTNVAADATLANTDLTNILTKARDSKNAIVEVYNDATDIITEATTGSSELTSMTVATANLVIGSGTSRVLYVAKVPGAVGEAVRVAHVAGGALAVAVVNKDITVTVAGATTAAAVAAAVTGNVNASALVEAYVLSDGSGTAATQALTYLGYTTPNSLALSGLRGSNQALLQQRFDRCKTEAASIQTSANAVQSNLDGSPSAVIPKALDAQAQLAAIGLNLVTTGTELYAAEQQRQLVNGTYLPAINTAANTIDTLVLPLDSALDPVTGKPLGAVANSVGEELLNIYQHVDSILSADCQSNLVTVPILSKNAAGFYAGPSLGLQQALQAYLDARKEVTQTVQVTSGENYLRRPRILLRVGVLLGYAESVVRAAVETVVDDILRDRDFGQSLFVSELTCAVLEVPGVGFVNATIQGWNDNGTYSPASSTPLVPTGLDGNGNLIVSTSEVITKEVRTGVPSVTIATEIVTG